ncbi:hypothetical protein VHEMI04027 [[Torrubiella] hemipterigena]|uniref:PLD phosphodiesterase domain-containing protein n=1 Tax=[Torrubiella] hemipterigena TaxID=1531966 RepID=A0A0A1TCM4_9HYPO|nr:hypothetical protein VHEMI04027 [[Torrubiella] hemipterigena]
MPSDRVLQLCQDTNTVSSIWAKDTTKVPDKIIQQLYSGHAQGNAKAFRQPASEEAQNKALKCGRWGPSTPSPLFLQAFTDALNCLEADPMSGVVSPPLMGSHGTMPLTVIAPLADVIRHCANLIVRAERQVFFITCAWSPSIAQRLVHDALLELSRRSVARGKHVQVNLMYDGMSMAHLNHSHNVVSCDKYTSKAIGLPGPQDIPNVDLTVVSLHKLPLGTLHAKFCVVDGKVAAIMSNNMQDNDNLEMMTHVEGPIVDSVYDTAVITWNQACKSEKKQPASEDGLPVDNGQNLPPTKATMNGTIAREKEPKLPECSTYDQDVEAELVRMREKYSHSESESNLQVVNRQLNICAKEKIDLTGPEIPEGDEFRAYISTATSQPVPMAMVSRRPYAYFGSKDECVPQNEAWLSLIRNAKQSIFIQTPDLNAAPLLPAMASALKRGVEVVYYVCFGYNDLGEMIPGQGGTNEQAAISLINSLPRDGPERDLLHIYNYVAKDQDHPIHHRFKTRSCHIKLLIADGCVGIQGSGNQDTQSWFHSQEVNIMVDSREICQKWREAIDRNQNTGRFGRVAKDGIWRDQQGNPGAGYSGNPGFLGGLVKGTIGMVLKAEGLGGF